MRDMHCCDARNLEGTILDKTLSFFRSRKGREGFKEMSDEPGCADGLGFLDQGPKVTQGEREALDYHNC